MPNLQISKLPKEQKGLGRGGGWFPVVISGWVGGCPEVQEVSRAPLVWPDTTRVPKARGTPVPGSDREHEPGIVAATC